MMKNMNNSKKVIFAVITAAILTAPAAYAGAVTNYTGNDSFNAKPHIKGNNIIHLRLDSSFNGNSNSNALSPGLNLTTSLMDGLDFGIGGGLNFNGLGSPLNNMSAGAVY